MKIICQICNKDFKSYGGLRGHLRTHKINTKEYEDKYGIIDSNTIKTNTCKICKTKIKLKSIIHIEPNSMKQLFIPIKQI